MCCVDDVKVRENRFVFIGKNLDRPFLTEGFMACKVGSYPPRTEDKKGKV